ncbi:MAG TPA: hypothetical protein VF945_07540 [Polyangia bacterium]
MRSCMLLCIALAGAAAGCATTDILKDASVGHTGCTQDEMVVSDVDRDLGRAQWVVQCRGHLFLCSQLGHDIACHERLPDKPLDNPPRME